MNARGKKKEGAIGTASTMMLFVAFTFASLAQAQSGTVTATVNANLSQGIYLQSTGDLNFGDIAASAGGGTVELTPAGAVTATGVSAVANPANPPSPAAYAVSILGNKGTKKFWIQVPANGSVSLTGPGAPMSLSNFTVSIPCSQVSAVPPGGSGPCSAAPTTFTLGATLIVNPNQMPGLYTGLFSVTAHRF